VPSSEIVVSAPLSGFGDLPGFADSWGLDVASGFTGVADPSSDAEGDATGAAEADGDGAWVAGDSGGSVAVTVGAADGPGDPATGVEDGEGDAASTGMAIATRATAAATATPTRRFDSLTRQSSSRNLAIERVIERPSP
jgi:hypothetical protein